MTTRSGPRRSVEARGPPRRRVCYNTLRADAGFGGGTGAFGFTDTFGIDIDGTQRGDPSRPKPAGEPGTIEVTVDNADVSDLRIVVTGSQ